MGGVCDTQGEKIRAYRILVGTTEKKDHLECLGLGRRITLKWIFRK
jgi:hypothetical protein